MRTFTRCRLYVAMHPLFDHKKTLEVTTERAKRTIYALVVDAKSVTFDPDFPLQQLPISHARRNL